MLNKKICFISSDGGGCYLYRVKYIAEFLKQEYSKLFPFAVVGDGLLSIKDERILNSDIIVLQRQSDPIFLEAIRDLKSLGKKVVFDIDDLLWNIPATNLAYSAYGPKALKDLDNVIRLCDYITVSTFPLYEFMKNRFNIPVKVIPNMLPKLFDYRELNNNKLRIGFVGSVTHNNDFSFHLCQALRQLKDVELVFMGYNPIPGADVEYHEFCPVEEYMDKLFSLNLDIGLCPLENNIFNKNKSNIKFLELSSCSSISIASNAYPFNNINSAVGRLVSKEKDWKFTIDSLIKYKERNIISKNAYDYVNKYYTYENNGNVIIDAWQDIISELYQ